MTFDRTGRVKLTATYTVGVGSDHEAAFERLATDSPTVFSVRQLVILGDLARQNGIT